MSDTVPELVRVFASTTSLLNEAALLLELPSRRLVQVNRVFFETLAYAPHEVIGCTPQQGGWWPDVAVMEQFIATINGTGTLVAEGHEGIRSVMLGNSIMLSSHLSQAVTLPLDGDPYEAVLKERAANSRFVKTVVETEVDMGKSFSK